MKKQDRITESQLRALLDREWRECLLSARHKADEVPPHWETTDQVAARLRIAVSSAQRALLSGVRAGKIVRRKFRTVLAGGRLRRVPHYCPKALAEKELHVAQESSFPRSD
jgi:hypothetical protein